MILSGKKPIATLDELRVHLQFAIGLELATIPVYLTALYSIPDGENTAASRVIQSVVIEEMLHMALAGNVLNAIGGIPSTAPIAGIGDPIPHFPAIIPFLPSLGIINLRRFSRPAVETFIDIERPNTCDKQPEQGYRSIGCFYAAISQGIKTLCDDSVFEQARKTRGHCQISGEEYYGGAGKLFAVTDKASALKAIDEIVHQGEGVSEEILDKTVCAHADTMANEESIEDGDTLADGWKMYSHYVRFREIQFGRRYVPTQKITDTPAGDIIPIDWSEVYPTVTNPQAVDYKGTDIEPAVDSFNRTYTQLIDNIYAAFNGEKSDVAQGEPAGMRKAVTVMWDLKYQAIALMKTPSPLVTHQGETVGAPFEYLR